MTLAEQEMGMKSKGVEGVGLRAEVLRPELAAATCVLFLASDLWLGNIQKST